MTEGTIIESLRLVEKNAAARGDIPTIRVGRSTRWMRKPDTFTGPAQALRRTVQTYRKALWEDAPAYVEIWLEKDALAGVLVDVTDEFDVPLMVARGYASLSFLHSAAEAMEGEHRPCFVYHFGDFDPSGVNAAETIERTLRELAPGVDINFTRAAVTPNQIERWRLPSRPTKRSDSRAKSWGGGDLSVELDAIPPATLRRLVRFHIERHLPAAQLKRLRTVEAAERKTLIGFASAWDNRDGTADVRRPR
jgi:hypothetical protein